jgi:hypothetical protein
MPEVRNNKSQAKDLYDGARKGRARYSNTSCSRFVLLMLIVSGTFGVSLEFRAITCQVPSVSRESAPAAKLQQPEDASATIGWRQFKQA